VTGGSEETVEELLEQSEAAMREVGVKLNELSGRVLEIKEFQASLRKAIRKGM
jgi:hypothetical protein